jgi:hypothetical protein
MHRKQTSRQLALDAARELLDHLELQPEERLLVLGLALERFDSVRAVLEKLGASRDCISAVFAAALEYSESLINHHDDSGAK